MDEHESSSAVVVVDKEEDIENKKHRASIFGNGKIQPWPFRAGPTLEVISIEIFSPLLFPYVIFGEITAFDHMVKKKLFYFFSADDSVEQLERIDPGWNNLRLTDCPIAPVSGGMVTFKLTNYCNDDQVFDNVYDMNKAIKQQDGTFVLQGDGFSGFHFRMIFTPLPFAAIAHIVMIAKLTIPDSGEEEKEEKKEEYYQLHGKITANKFVCFKTEIDDPILMKYGRNTYVPICRNFYAVPVNSKLAVEVELYNGTRCLIEAKREFRASRGTRMPQQPTLYFDSKVADFHFGVIVHWILHEDFFAYSRQHESDNYPPMFFKLSKPLSPGALVEVFSVVFGGGVSSDSRDIDLYGAIVVCDGDKKFNILAHNKDCPGKLLSSSKNDEQQFRTLSLEWPDDRWVVGEKFGLYLKLKDAKGNLVCVGLISWFDEDSRYDCRLCDVFRGAKPYIAAVQYSIFKNGKKAKISVECSNGPLSIYGTIYAKYDKYDYSSSYDEECYRSILFKRSEEDAIKVISEIGLLKSQVSAPSDCDELIVCVDLWVCHLSSSYPPQRCNFNTNEAKSRDLVGDLAGTSLTVRVDWVSG